ncbi:hypothetical protein D5400_20650 [Georhizobium profundi]|uniref:Uncharacterized protein n=1 Tax=Georhizobium profundi TaxID=2341112 RepID=A0A3Q8XRJ0_9HYPH|nr:hypothetical protein D5400_20650 [Georhizobium profundi]
MIPVAKASRAAWRAISRTSSTNAGEGFDEEDWAEGRGGRVDAASATSVASEASDGLQALDPEDGELAIALIHRHLGARPGNEMDQAEAGKRSTWA